MLLIYWFIVFFLIGTVLGSFYNVVGLRLPKKKTFYARRSHCPNCHQQLEWYELIPILSYLSQKGKCRECSAKISSIYPVVEFMTGGLFAFSYWQLGFQLEFIMSLLLMSMLMIVFVADITYMVIPNKVLLFFLPFFIVLRIMDPLTPWYDAIVGGAIGYSLIAVIIIVSKGGMGAGDMKLFGVLGIILGLKSILLTFILSSLFGAIIGLILKGLNKVEKQQPIAFGPYIVVAAIITYFFGDNIIKFYFSLF